MTTLSSDNARNAAVKAALNHVPESGVIGLGSGRAVFLMAQTIAERSNVENYRFVSASSLTTQVAVSAGLQLVDLEQVNQVNVAFDGADEITPELHMVKGGGGALVREKILLEFASKRIIMAEESKLVSKLGDNWRLPVEVVDFAAKKTLERLHAMGFEGQIRKNGNKDFVTDNHNRIIDVELPDSYDEKSISSEIKALTGVVDHGLFLHHADVAYLGQESGSVRKLGV